MKTRFAPSPTGYLHIGHALSAYTAWSWARDNNAEFILRIEDIDTTRCKPKYTEAIFEDLQWLGINWSGEVLHQSQRFAIYANALDRLKQQNLLYPCFATRKDIEHYIQEHACAKTIGADGILYPKIWRGANLKTCEELSAKGIPYCQRFKTDKAYSQMQGLTFTDTNQGTVNVNPDICGDIILMRKDIPTSYHLSVCVDDYLQGITHIIRGQDLFQQTHIHRIVQEALAFDEPIYTHHHLITDETNKKFSKTDKSLTIRSLRKQGYRPNDVLKMVGITV